VGRPPLQHSKQVARNIDADSYTAMERMACNNSRWKAAQMESCQPIKRLTDKKKQEEEEKKEKEEEEKKKKILLRKIDHHGFTLSDLTNSQLYS
jgi:hypothetical protein